MNLKYIKSLVLFFAAALFVMGGCEKSEFTDNPELNELTTTEQSEVQSDYIFYIDDEITTEQEYNSFTEKSDDLLVIQTALDSKIALYAYTTEEAFIAYGKRNGINLKGQLEFERLMREYVKMHDVEHTFETTGVIPKEYLDYEAECHKKIFGENTKANSISFYNDRNGSGVPLNVFHTLAVVGWPYNNNIESFKVNGLVAYNFAVYNRFFYRNRLATYTGQVYWEHLEEMSSYVKNKTGSINKWW